MAAGKTLNAANLEQLGAASLAELLIEISRGNAVAQRRLRLALAGNAGAEQAIRAVARRLTSIAGARTWLNWQKIKSFVTELEAQHRAILTLIAPSEPRDAFDLLWRLAGCAAPVFARSDDNGGRLAAAFEAAVQDLGPLAHRAGLSAEELSDRVVRALSDDAPGVWHTLIPVLAVQLGPVGLQQVGTALRDWQTAAVVPSTAGGSGAGGRAGAIGPQTLHGRHRVAVLLQQVADASGDVDGFIEQHDARSRSMPAIAAGIARRLLTAGRPAEAWAALDRVPPAERDRAPEAWDEARVDILCALGRAEEAQSFRWQRFLLTLSVGHLRAYLRALPDFDDFEAEQRAMAHALAFGDIHRALLFLLEWPDLHGANELVLTRTRQLNGDLFEILSPAADALDHRYSLAATLIRRAMISFSLGASRSSRYRHAARHLLDCRACADRVADFAGVPDHAEYERALRATHGRKVAFWQELGALS